MKYITLKDWIDNGRKGRIFMHCSIRKNETGIIEILHANADGWIGFAKNNELCTLQISPMLNLLWLED